LQGSSVKAQKMNGLDFLLDGPGKTGPFFLSHNISLTGFFPSRDFLLMPKF